MADRFEDLGIAPELVAGVERVGWDAPGGLQESALPVIRRGNNVVLHASAGSGVVGAYGLGILDRLLEDDDATTSGPRVLVLVPDAAAAARTADSLARLATATPLAVRANGPGWAHGPADLLVTTPAAATAAVRDSALKLEGLQALVVDGLDQLDATGQWDDLETMVDIVPPGAQRVVCSGILDGRADGFVERHVRRAMTIPPRTVEGDEAPPKGGVPVRYRMVAESERAAAVVALLPTMEATEVAVVCRSQDRADEMERALEARGVATEGGDDGPRVLVLPRPEADQRSTRADVISADVPFDADALANLHGRGGAVLATPRERAHLLRIARRAGIALKPVVAPDPAPLSPAERVRDQLRGVLAEADLAADLALLEPIFAEHPPEVVAAAALSLARSTHQGAGTAPARAPERSEKTPAVGKRPGAGAPPPSSATTWTHLFISIGSRDDVSAGDLVGAMTGEAGISGDQVGKIDIRTSHSTVEVATPVADTVISALNGRTLKGRSLRVDYDRKTRAPRPGGGKSGERGGGRRPGGASERRGPGGRSGGPGGRSGGSGGRSSGPRGRGGDR